MNCSVFSCQYLDFNMSRILKKFFYVYFIITKIFFSFRFCSRKKCFKFFLFSHDFHPFTTSTTVVLGDQGLLISRALPVLASAPVGGLLATRAGSRGIPPSCPSVSPHFGSLLGLSVVLCSGYPGCPVDAATAADRTQQPSTPLGGPHTSPRVTFVGPPRCYSAEITGATAHSTDTPYRGRSGLR